MRIVSLCPSITKLVFDLDCGSNLVAVTKYCIHPEEGVADLEKVGGTKDPKRERILALKPDLVLLNQEENRREDWEFFAGHGLNCHVSYPLDVPQSIDFVRDLGAVLERQSKAAEIIAEIEVAQAKLKQRLAGVPPKSWAYLIWRKPWMTVNGQTYISALLNESGGHNVFGNRPDQFPAIEAEELGAADPQRVFLSSEPFPFKEKHIAELSQATGLPVDRFRLVDGERLSWHGSMTAAGLDLVSELFS